MTGTVLQGPGPTLLRHALRDALMPVLPTAAYAARTCLAIGLALYGAFFLQLSSPLSAVTTVLIVANPVSGALVSKSLWRLGGTVFGAAVAVALMAAFAQMPLLFTVALSLCIGLACVVASLLRYFRAYGAVLAGYTIVIVTSGALANPENIFIVALSRVSAVSLGIAVTAAVFLLTSLPGRAALEARIETLVRDIASGFIAYRQADAAQFAATLPRDTLLARAGQLDEAIDYAAAEDSGIRSRRDALRRGAARLLGLLSTLEPLHTGLSHSAVAGQARDEAHAVLQSLAGLKPRGLAAMLPHIQAAQARLRALPVQDGDARTLTVLGHERDLLLQWEHAVADLSGTPVAGAALRLTPFLEWNTAFRNGARGLVVTLLGGLVWYATQWTAGPSMLAFLVPAACLLSTNPSAAAASVQMASGVLLGIPASMICQIFILPQITGFPLLWAGLCLCLLPGIWLQFSPRHGTRAFGYVVFFVAMINVRNPISFNDIDLFNTWLGMAIGCTCLMLVFRVLLPPDPARDVRRLAASLGRAVARLPATRRVPRWQNWQYRQMQKVLRLSQRMQQARGLPDVAIAQAAYASVALGRSVIFLSGLQDPAVPAALAALRLVRARPDEAVARLAALVADTEARLQAEPAAPLTRQVLATLGETLVLLRKSAGLLERRCSVLGPDLE